MNTVSCKARRMNDEMQCVCGLTWDIDEESPCSVGDLDDARKRFLNEVDKFLGDTDVQSNK